MKLAVSWDEQGTITTLFNPEQMNSGGITISYVPAPGENHRVLEVPGDLEDRPFEDLPALLRVNATGEHPRFEQRA